jgi:hypothetical protein
MQIQPISPNDPNAAPFDGQFINRIDELIENCATDVKKPSPLESVRNGNPKLI